MRVFSSFKTKILGFIKRPPPEVSGKVDVFVEEPPPTPTLDTPTWKNMSISPSGAWFEPQHPNPPDEHTPQHPLPPIPTITTNAIDTIWSMPEAGSLYMVVSKPPHFYPHRDDLHIKLEQCLDLGIITSCIHKSSGRAYLLDIELPGTPDRTKDLEKIKLFIKVMEKQYKLIIVQQNAVNKLTAPGCFYRTVFEYKEEQS